MKKTAKKKVLKIASTPKKVIRNKESRGISKIVVVVFAALVLAGAGGFYFLSQKSGVSVIPGVKAPLNPNCEYNDPELCKFVNNMTGMNKYRVTSTSSFEGMTSESVMEIDGEDKFHMMSTVNGKENSNMITIGDTTYTKDYTDNKWWKQTYSPEESQEDPARETRDDYEMDFGSEKPEDNTTYKFIAKEACGDLTCFKYEMSVSSSEGMAQFIWFDDREYLMRKTSYEGEGGLSESVYSYDTVSISAPSPVKEGTPDLNAMPGYSEEDVRKMMEQYQEQAPVDDAETMDMTTEEHSSEFIEYAE